MTSSEYQQVIESLYEKVVATNFDRLKKSIDASMAEGLGAPMPMEVHVETANTLNSICSYYDVLLKEKSVVKDASWLQACRFANNRLKHDRRTAGMVQKNGGFYFYGGQCHPGIHFEEPFHPKIDPNKPVRVPAFVSIVPNVNWVLVGDIQPEEDGSDRYKDAFLKQKKAYRQHFEGRCVIDTLKRAIAELGIDV